MRVVSIIAIAALAAGALASCEHTDNERLPYAPVNITFWTQADWITYGPAGAASHRDFIREKRIPASYPFTADTYTGFGGVMLCTDYNGVPHAYDLACPVECSRDVRVAINSDLLAECPKCHSLYDVFALDGGAVGGPAARDHYGLTVYRTGPGPQGEYLTVTY
ncbi:MAG: hypothetical protein NC406_00805 [Bacteroides sp.]|nr:hypothetical protein [Bacteroides sp.]MCM1095260.1 hypothetical protein [Terasakiella sp.]